LQKKKKSVWDTAGLLELLDGVLQFTEQRTHKSSKILKTDCRTLKNSISSLISYPGSSSDKHTTITKEKQQETRNYVTSIHPECENKMGLLPFV
jgi:hypothetical protein